jgi:DNA-binding Lrp family transcriptional regulator
MFAGGSEREWMMAKTAKRAGPKDAPKSPAKSDLDDRIIDLLVTNGRTTNRMIAEALSVSEAIIGGRVRRLIKSRTIKLTLQKDIYAFGYPYIYTVDVKVSPGMYRSAARKMQVLDEIINISTILDEHQLRIMLAVADSERLHSLLHDILAGIEGVVEIKFDAVVTIYKYLSKYGAVELT